MKRDLESFAEFISDTGPREISESPSVLAETLASARALYFSQGKEHRHVWLDESLGLSRQAQRDLLRENGYEDLV